MNEEKTLGEVYWDAYAKHDVAYVAEVKFGELSSAVRGAIEVGAQAVAEAAIQRRIDSLGTTAFPVAAPDENPSARYALVEQMGHRVTVAAIRETTFCGKQMIEATDLKGGGTSLISPESIYEITWITESDALARTKPWTATAITAGSNQWREDNPDQDDEAWPGDEPDEAEQRAADLQAHVSGNGGPSPEYVTDAAAGADQ